MFAAASLSRVSDVICIPSILHTLLTPKSSHELTPQSTVISKFSDIRIRDMETLFPQKSYTMLSL
jgi:hypothetical protein